MFFDSVNRPNQIWLGDFCFLTRRYAYSSMFERRVKPNIPIKERGFFHKTGLKKNATYYPKWSRYTFRGKFSQRVSEIKVYDRPIVLFCVMDLYSRYIVYAKLERCPKSFMNRPYAFPSAWFNLQESLTEIGIRNIDRTENLEHKGYPFAEKLFLDSEIYTRFHKKLEKYSQCFKINNQVKVLLSPLESFFFTIQFNFREELTNENLGQWIKYYNEFRSMKRTRYSYLRGKTPEEVYLSK